MGIGVYYIHHHKKSNWFEYHFRREIKFLCLAQWTSLQKYYATIWATRPMETEQPWKNQSMPFFLACVCNFLPKKIIWHNSNEEFVKCLYSRYITADWPSKHAEIYYFILFAGRLKRLPSTARLSRIWYLYRLFWVSTSLLWSVDGGINTCAFPGRTGGRLPSL